VQVDGNIFCIKGNYSGTSVFSTGLQTNFRVMVFNATFNNISVILWL